MTAAQAAGALDAVRCHLALGGAEEVTPGELWRLCREVDAAAAGDLYAALLRDGHLVPVDTPFGPRLGVTGSVVEAAERSLRNTAPPPGRLPAEEVFPVPSLLHDLLTLAAFVRREQPRVTGRGLLSAPALRRLEGLALTPDTVAPQLDRRSPAGTHVWQFLFRFLCAQGLVRLEGGRAAAASDSLAAAVARHGPSFAALLFTFSAARRPVGDSGWLGALERPLPAAWERRRLVAWLAQAGVRAPDAAVDRTGQLLEALGFARLLGPQLVLLPAAAVLWSGVRSAGRDERAPEAVGARQATVALPGGGVAVDIAAGEAALAARLPHDREAAPESVGHLLVYGTAGRGRASDSGPRLKVRVGAIVRGDDDALLAAVAEAMGEAALARWPGGLAVELLAMEEAVERLGRLGGRVERQAPWTGHAADQAGALPPARDAALPWSLARAREGAWASDGSGAFRPLRAPAAVSPAQAQALPTVPARLRAAAALGWPVALSLAAGERRALVVDVRWEGGDERATVVWLDGGGDEVPVPSSAVADVRFLHAGQEADLGARA